MIKGKEESCRIKDINEQAVGSRRKKNCWIKDKQASCRIIYEFTSCRIKINKQVVGSSINEQAVRSRKNEQAVGSIGTRFMIQEPGLYCRNHDRDQGTRFRIKKPAQNNVTEQVQFTIYYNLKRGFYTITMSIT